MENKKENVREKILKFLNHPIGKIIFYVIFISLVTWGFACSTTMKNDEFVEQVNDVFREIVTKSIEPELKAINEKISKLEKNNISVKYELIKKQAWKINNTIEDVKDIDIKTVRRYIRELKRDGYLDIIDELNPQIGVIEKYYTDNIDKF